ncbi:RING-H2 finger protein ATL7 [Drosophila eugracilis]|uniref:RING-H2 finger protein ATL7 n=1 Tax=Drosophila eugracilis TaxID=29029 RepID=UPI0007E5E8E5|nr:RING-H2 finger protein ATL7 [Drosophila eugracilis]
MSNNNVICTICSERYRAVDHIQAGSCGHAFHEECLDRWRSLSRTCPICRCQNATYIQLYLNFEDSPQSGSVHGASGSGHNQGQGHIGSSSSSSTVSSDNGSGGSSNTSSSTSDYAGIMREYENLLYETGVYQDEIEYLNERIGILTLRNSRDSHESDSEDQ